MEPAIIGRAVVAVVVEVDTTGVAVLVPAAPVVDILLRRGTLGASGSFVAKHLSHELFILLLHGRQGLLETS